MQIHKEFCGIPGIFTAKNTAEFRGIPRNPVCFFKKFRIPSEVKNALPWTPYPCVEKTVGRAVKYAAVVQK
jgi:hypothetical protein